jgi:molecular chaperone GrpE
MAEDTTHSAVERSAEVGERPDPNPSGDAVQTPEHSEYRALKADRDDIYDRLLRKTAEFENYRRRIERERREQGDQAVLDLLLELLLVVDDFDRALAVPSGNSPDQVTYRKGVELIQSKLQDLLRRQGVRAIEARGADFDPNLHQAVAHEASPGHRDGEVIDEMQRGYMKGDRLLRPAMVKVAKA